MDNENDNSTDTGMDLWVREVYHGTFGLQFKVVETLFSRRSPYQRVDVVRTAGFGRMLLCDGAVMLTEGDEFVYHEMIAHVPLFVHPKPASVLVIGGGDGGTAREVLRHESVSRCVMVEIDEMVVEASREHLPGMGPWDDPRLDLRIADGVEFTRTTEERFDVVIVDSTDPVGPATVLFSEGFYADVARVLTDDGILVAQAESPYFDGMVQRRMLENQRTHFPRLHLYNISNLSYPGGLWSLTFASRGLCPIRDFREDAARAGGFETRYYNPMIHRAAFGLPEFVRKNIQGVADEPPSA
ncbi:MAG: polyamine aminopropyltransferase [Desulfatibacillaceae bacterium]